MESAHFGLVGVLRAYIKFGWAGPPQISVSGAILFPALLASNVLAHCPPYVGSSAPLYLARRRSQNETPARLLGAMSYSPGAGAILIG